MNPYALCLLIVAPGVNLPPAPPPPVTYDSILQELNDDFPQRGSYAKQGWSLVETKADRELRFRVIRGDAEAMWLDNKAKVRVNCRIRAKTVAKPRDCITRTKAGTKTLHSMRMIPMPSLVAAEQWAEAFNAYASLARQDKVDEIKSTFNTTLAGRFKLVSPAGDHCNAKVKDLAAGETWRFDAREVKTRFYSADGLFEAKLECKNNTGECIDLVGGSDRTFVRLGLAALSEAQLVADSLNDLNEICEI